MDGLMLMMGVGFLVPGLAVAGAVAVGLPVLVHLLSRIKRKKWYWGAMRFLDEAIRRQRRRLLLEQWLLLMMRCLIVLLLGFAMAGMLVDRAWLRGLMGQGKGRLVHVVLDTSLSGGIVEGTKSRLELGKDAANRVIDGLDGRDEVVIWGMGRGAGGDELLWEGIKGKDVAWREAMDGIDVGRGGHDWEGVMRGMSARREAMGEGVYDEEIVYVFSGFSDSDGYLDGEVGDRMLGDGVRYVVSEPRDGVGESWGNVQVLDVEMESEWVLREMGREVVVGLRAKLRRFSDQEGRGRVLVQVYSLRGDVMGHAELEVVWEDAERDKAVNVPVVIGNGAGDVRVEVKYEAERGDVIAADSIVQRMVRLEEGVKIGVFGEAWSGDGSEWLEVALSPSVMGDDGVGVVRLGDVSRLDEVDVLVIVGEVLGEAAEWIEVKDWVEGGGHVWVWPGKVGEKKGWIGEGMRAVNSDWEVVGFAYGNGYSARLADSVEQAERLKGVRGEWGDLVRTVQVNGLVRYNRDEDAGDEGVLVKTRNGEAVVVSDVVGRGEVVWWGVGLSEGWGNMVSKPIFVGLVHEMLKGVMSGGVKRGIARVEYGDEVGGDMLRVWGEANQGIGHGVYVNIDDGGEDEKVVIVETAMSAGDVRVIDRGDFERYWGQFGDWMMVGWDEPEVGLRVDQAGMNVSWYLLWAVLGLVLGEMLLARKMSYAVDESRRTVWGRARGVLMRLRDREGGTSHG
ncbi:hypothetical protein KS4_00120 [Poriferisphaera corsica]|uniref:Aerotolerance regulator N-terminal domain-containing protein n=1 Tax=Poriferisphaera corsica TaxID=2528020 RepID=A0A517YP38_9BACT|nr:BatA domain-containing protein [Poriferisphaera corsica]QDU31984.1 hypothetical protein KS4_00120 [Poriferisphaera corsica]